MAVRSVRYAPYLQATVLLERFVVQDWEAVEGRGQRASSTNGLEVVVYQDQSRVQLVGDLGPEMDNLEAAITEVLNGTVSQDRNLNAFLDSEDCQSERRHIDRLCQQINECYAIKAYDAVAVLMRRVTEALIIECFIAKGIQNTIIVDGKFLMFGPLIVAAEGENTAGTWRLTPKTREALPKIKEVGDNAAHGRSYLTKKQDVDDLRYRFCQALQCLKEVAGISK
jgi:hypothetical protein